MLINDALIVFNVKKKEEEEVCAQQHKEKTKRESRLCCFGHKSVAGLVLNLVTNFQGKLLLFIKFILLAVP